MAVTKRHPFDPLSPEEITAAAEASRPMFPNCSIDFRAISYQEPPKKQMIAYLETQHSPDRDATIAIPPPPRVARVQLIIENSPGKPYKLYELFVDVSPVNDGQDGHLQGKVVTKNYMEGRHSYIDGRYMRAAERACAEDERVKKEIESLSLPEGSEVVIEPWAYGTDGMGDMSTRTTMCYFYARLTSNPDANYYAYPLDLCVEVSEDLKVSQIYRLPSSTHETIHTTPLRTFDTDKIQSPTSSEYHPSLRSPPRTTTKPYLVSQPDGPSFHIAHYTNFLTWEKWSLHVGFNYREGLTLHDIRYDSRSLFYRLSLAEMFVPYADPRTPYTRKAAFDLGSDGAGVCANNLQLGCDCLGVIKYFDFWHVNADGTPLKLPNVVCCHEQDDGILWKHTNPRTGNAIVVRSRILVLQTIITVSNYEYIFAFHFGQDGSVNYEVRATGILSTVPVELEDCGKEGKDGGRLPPWGTVVAPGVLAPYHQHLFCLRIDPAVDGWENTVVVEESVSLPRTESLDSNQVQEGKAMAVNGMSKSTTTTARVIHNPLGIGYITTSTPINSETGLDLDHTKNRVFKIVNENKINPITNTPVGFKLLPCYSQMLLAHPESHHSRRSEFAEHAVWVTRYVDDEIFPAGRWTMQSLGGEGIKSVIERRREEQQAKVAKQENQQEDYREVDEGEEEEEGEEDLTNTRNKDIVVWHTFGSTHNPRIEDWPVMPQDRMTVGLKPVNFFTGNPSMDVKPSTMDGIDAGASVLYNGGEGGGACCG